MDNFVNGLPMAPIIICDPRSDIPLMTQVIEVNHPLHGCPQGLLYHYLGDDYAVVSHDPYTIGFVEADGLLAIARLAVLEDKLRKITWDHRLRRMKSNLNIGSLVGLVVNVLIMMIDMLMHGFTIGDSYMVTTIVLITIYFVTARR